MKPNSTVPVDTRVDSAGGNEPAAGPSPATEGKTASEEVTSNCWVNLSSPIKLLLRQGDAWTPCDAAFNSMLHSDGQDACQLVLTPLSNELRAHSVAVTVPLHGAMQLTPPLPHVGPGLVLGVESLSYREVQGRAEDSFSPPGWEEREWAEETAWRELGEVAAEAWGEGCRVRRRVTVSGLR